MKKYLIFHGLHWLVFYTAKTDGKIIKPTSTLGSIHQVPGHVTFIVVVEQGQNGQREGAQPQVPAIVMTLAIGSII